MFVYVHQCTKLPGGHLSQMDHIKDSETVIEEELGNYKGTFKKKERVKWKKV